MILSDAAIIPSGGEDRWGDPLPSGEPVVVRDVVTWPRYSDESTQGTVITGINAMFPVGAEVPDAIDAVIVDIETDDSGAMVPGTGRRHVVVGDPGVWHYLDGGEAGTEVALKRMRG